MKNNVLSRVDASYKKMRMEVISITFFSYIVFYIARKNFAAAAPALMSSIGMTDTQFGLMSSGFYIIYGLSKFGSGFIADNVNVRFILGPVLILIGIVNILLGSSSSIIILTGLYWLTAILQGSGFPPIAKSLNFWFSKKERGMWYSIWNSSHNIGGALAPLIASQAIVMTGNWRMAFYVPAVIAIAMGIIALVFMKDKPEKYKLPSIGQWKQDKAEIQVEAKSAIVMSTWQMFIRYVLLNPVVLFAIFGDLCIYVVRTSVNDWSAIYFTQVANWGLDKSNSLNFWFEIGGIVGGLVGGFISDIFFKSNRWTSCAVYVLILFVSFILLPFAIDTSYLLTSLIFMAIGAGIYGPQLLFALGIIESVHKNAAGAATGLKGFITYLGAAMAGLPIALVKVSYSWTGVFTVIIFMNILLIFVLTLLIYTERKQNKIVSI
ncbi:MFS transporter [Francisella adeliensis]|uniref:MFS transporter n=1 Tax=Francisella adeliensis TaxID=2007306 RepID=A0A2Z4XXA9_9GAMM|nr:MFS transporter [Francisella adeliensis]AXA33356.1 MFS transporter [Francisella adeliensis]MBK2085368.1 MFS transporter [Francisella adeliensis]MBK2097098.1 MFS transporter [Francisella adeliensis]QIW11583.1 MFS transporter [Francisella adeliensis]QIW13459.1 MFS transporter [Francisella adeliensis]